LAEIPAVDITLLCHYISKKRFLMKGNTINERRSSNSSYRNQQIGGVYNF